MPNCAARHSLCDIRLKLQKLRRFETSFANQGGGLFIRKLRIGLCNLADANVQNGPKFSIGKMQRSLSVDVTFPVSVAILLFDETTQCSGIRMDQSSQLFRAISGRSTLGWRSALWHQPPLVAIRMADLYPMCLIRWRFESRNREHIPVIALVGLIERLF